jgi:predicted amidohydrolase YtcJ
VIAGIAATADAAEPTLIVHHGKIVTVDAKFSMAEAIAIDGDRITAVGSNDDVLRLAGPKTQQIDLEGKTVLPGLIDSHVHPLGAAMYEFDHPLPEMETVADVLKYVAGRADLLPDGEWIKVQQVFITRLRDHR